MIRKDVIRNLFLVLNRFLASGEIIFSRDSLLSKLGRLAAWDGATRYYLNQTIKRLEKRNLFEVREKNGRIFYRLTPAGFKKVSYYKFKELKIEKKWDGWWRVITFDIPENKRIGRDLIREKLKHFGFFPLQKSVFICPFKCEEAIEILGDYFGISDYLELFLTRSVGRREEELKKFFGG